MRSPIRPSGDRFGRALAALATAVALVATLSPRGSAPMPAPDWALHALGFGALAVLYARALDGRSPRVVLAGACCLAVALGGAIELVQPTVGRTASLGDLLANTAGAALSLAGWHAVRRWRAPA